VLLLSDNNCFKLIGSSLFSLSSHITCLSLKNRNGVFGDAVLFFLVLWPLAGSPWDSLHYESGLMMTVKLPLLVVLKTPQKLRSFCACACLVCCCVASPTQ
jgi:hypothetical protein